MEGVWINFGPGAAARIARWNNRNFQEFVYSKAKPYLRDTPLEPGEDQMEHITKEAVAHHILLELKGEWQEEVDEDVQDIVLSPETAIRLFYELPDFYEAVVSVSKELDDARERHIEGTVGNLPRTFSGVCGGEEKSRSWRLFQPLVSPFLRLRTVPLYPSTRLGW